MVAITRRLDPRPAILVSATLAVVAVTVALGAILGEEPSLRAAGVAAATGLGAMVVADTARGRLWFAGGDTIRLTGAAGAMLAVPAALLALAPTMSAGVDRLAGDDRVTTAVAVSSHTHQSAESVVIVAADAASDAVAATPLAAAAGGPLLLTPAEGLASAVATEIDRLGASRAYVIGAVGQSSTLTAELRDAGIDDVVAIAGADRYATSAAVASQLRPQRVYVASSWADAVAVAPLAADGGAILTVRPETVPASTSEALGLLSPAEVVVVGGAAAVSEEVETFLEGLLPDAEVSRLAGADRWATSLAVLEGTGAPTDRVWIGSGESWSDALAAAVGANAQSRPVLLVPSTGASPSAASVQWLHRNATDLKQLTVVGGEAAVPQRLVDRITRR